MADLGTISSLPAGSVLNDRYEIKRLIGQGGMGIVYLAVDRQLDEAPRAIKTIKPDLLADPRGVKQLRAEAMAAQTLSHPNIVRIYHYEQWQGISYLVMEYIEGRTLAEILSEKEKLSEREFFAIAGQLCEGLAYAHQQGVIHQDIKPSNIFVEPSGHVKLADFGIARVTKDITTRMTGQLPSGTLIYTSPEVLRGEKPTPASDIYSLGIVFYEMLSGDPPFVRGDIFRQHQEYEPKPIEGLSGGLLSALMTGLEKEPSRRPADAKTYLGAISGERTAPGQQTRENAACCEVIEYPLSATRRPQNNEETTRQLRAEGKGWLTTLLLCLFCGIFGAHRFYTGHTRIATIQLITFGGLGVWWLVDMILILTDSFRHADGSVLVRW
jgi:serine/threonine protein kinase